MLNSLLADPQFESPSSAAAPQRPTVSVVVASYNEERNIAGALDSLLNQDYPSDRLEILVADGGSTDRTAEIVRGYMQVHANIRWLENPKRIPAGAWNTGYRASRADFVLIFSAHSVCAPDYVRTCIELLERTGAANVGGVQRAIGTSYASAAIAAAMSSRFGMGDAVHRYAETEQYVETVYGGAWRRETLDQLGGWDDVRPGNEDYELNYRLRQRGGRILLSPRIRIFYHTRASLPQLWRQYFRYGYHKAHMLRVHPESVRWRHCVPPTFVLSLVGSGALLALGNPVGWVVPAVYGLLSLSASAVAARRSGWRYLPLLPLAFLALHASWGAGLLAGVAKSGGWRQVLLLAGVSARKALFRRYRTRVASHA